MWGCLGFANYFIHNVTLYEGNAHIHLLFYHSRNFPLFLLFLEVANVMSLKDTFLHVKNVTNTLFSGFIKLFSWWRLLALFEEEDDFSSYYTRRDI